VSQDVRAWPVARRAAFEAQIPTKVLRQDPSRGTMHHARGCTIISCASNKRAAISDVPSGASVCVFSLKKRQVLINQFRSM